MELGWHWLRCFPWIDYVCTGEGEEVFPLFLRQVLREGHTQPIPGILGRHDRKFSFPPPLRNLDDSPVPDHSDYFEQLARSGVALEVGLPGFPLESSRGCWWGEKCQCVFCGDTQNGIAYRSKSASRVLAEIKGFAKAYRFRYFECVDDALDKKHIGTVFGKLGKCGSRPPFIYQARPDLTRNELRTLYAGGVQHLGVGIESLSNPVLRLMRKGTTGLGNIQLLRWCQEIGMEVSWRILYGFPGEPVSEYGRMTKLVPLLAHLRPPFDVVYIALKRFSPYGLNPKHFGLTDVRPWPSYSFIYPFGRKKLEGIAYNFIFRYADGRRPSQYTRPLRLQVCTWMELWETAGRSHPRLDLRASGDDVVITDTRPCAVRRRYHLKGLAAKIYMQCDSVQSLDALLKRFPTQGSDAAVKKSLGTLVANKLMIKDEGKYLSLAVIQKAAGRRSSD
jgi:ribosomal peptide maturation radical SAM protein 1